MSKNKVFAATVSAFPIALLLASLLPRGVSAATINPHYGEKHCTSCHLKLPASTPDGRMDYSFLAKQIDPTCMICHDQDCCTIARRHQTTHVSGINRWDREKYGRPEKLPLSDGYITCVTCHFWRRENNPSKKDYKLVRIVEISDRAINWTGLCSDCHKNY